MNKGNNNMIVADAIDNLTQEAKLCGMSTGDVCVLLGISQSYLRQLRHMLFNAKNETINKINLATEFLKEHGKDFKDNYSKEAIFSGKHAFLIQLRDKFYACNKLDK